MIVGDFVLKPIEIELSVAVFIPSVFIAITEASVAHPKGSSAPIIYGNVIAYVVFLRPRAVKNIIRSIIFVKLLKINYNLSVLSVKL
jgi:hypothetical protein